MEFLGLLWDEAIVRPLTNGLLLLYVLLFSNFGLAIIALTLLIRGITYPLTFKQLTQSRKMQAMQSKVKAIRDRYPNDPTRRSRETMALYKETGVNPMGCLGPFIVQIPILIGLFWTIRNTIGVNPEGLAGLASSLYGWLPVLDGAVPVNRSFLWLDLGQKDATMVLPLLSGVTMWVQQKMSAPVDVDPAQQSTQRMMLWMMPIFFVVISITFFSGLVLYWVISNVVGIIIQYFVSGWGSLRTVRLIPSFGSAPAVPPADEEVGDDGQREPGTDSKDSGRSNRDRPARARRRTRRGRNSRH
jgi:YidC/Oxa1 family membrane protein insertase